MRRRASPPDAATVQMSPPETKAISLPSGATAGSANAARAAGGADPCVSMAAAAKHAMKTRCIVPPNVSQDAASAHRDGAGLAKPAERYGLAHCHGRVEEL